MFYNTLSAPRHTVGKVWIKILFCLRVSLSPTIERQASIKSNERSERRLIKVDFSQLQDDEDEDEHSLSSPVSDAPGLWPQEEYHQLFDNTLAPYDLATDPHTGFRRHTLGVCHLDSHLGSQSVPQSRPCSRQSCNSSEADSVLLEPEVSVNHIFITQLYALFRNLND